MACFVNRTGVLLKIVLIVVLSRWLAFTSYFYEKTCGDISTSWILDFIFVNFQILTSWIHVFNIRNSRFNLQFQLHEFTISTSRFQHHEFTSWVHDFNFTNSTSRIHVLNFSFMNSCFEITISTSWFQYFIFTKLKSWIHEHKVEIVNSACWNRKFTKLKLWIRENEPDNSRCCSVTTGLSYILVPQMTKGHLLHKCIRNYLLLPNMYVKRRGMHLSATCYEY
jgi:hypothetical protein